jgi:PAS domain S-box-containing protein/excisionase family DNA binding protein
VAAELVTIEEYARRLGVSRRTVERWVSKGKVEVELLTGERVKGSVRIRVELDVTLDRYVCIHDAELRIIAVSDDYATMLGYEPHELIGRAGIELIAEPPADIGVRWAELLRDGHHSDVATLQHRDGRTLLFAYRTRVLSDGRYIAVGEPSE